MQEEDTYSQIPEEKRTQSWQPDPAVSFSTILGIDDPTINFMQSYLGVSDIHKDEDISDEPAWMGSVVPKF